MDTKRGDSIFKTKNRTSVLYDFSIVKKARFYVFQGTDIGTGGLKFTSTSEVLYAQINPAEMTAIIGAKRKVPKVPVVEGGQIYSPREWSTQEDDLRIPLKYDLYDEYMIGTADGLLQGAVNDRDLTSENATSLRKLIEYSKDYLKFLFFKWGTFEYFGYIKDLSVSYSAFSRFGNPLKASGELTLARAGSMAEGSGGTKNFEDTSASIIGIDIKEKVEDGLLRAEIGASQALR